MRALALAAAALLPAALFAQAAPQPGPNPSAPPPRAVSAAAPVGKVLFHQKCAMCHDAGGMGTGLLARRVQPAELTRRGDLDPDFVVAAARTGIGNMPAIPRGEASDAELRAIADYLSGPADRRK